MDSSTRIGMIGIGNMGHGIALTLVGKGHPLAFLEHPGNQPVDDLVAGGARPAASIAELVAASDVVILCVTGTPQVEAVLLGEGGVLASLGPAWSSSTTPRPSRPRPSAWPHGSPRRAAASSTRP